GRVIYGDEIMIIFARAILEENPSATIVGEVKCSQIMYDEITRLGGNAVMWKTGHSLIKSKMVELKAAMAGEMSGHIFFADRYLGFDDAVYASARLLEILVKKREKDPAFKFSSLLAGLPSSVVTPEYRVESSDDDKFKVIEEVKELVGKEVGEGSNIRDLIDIDGLRVVFNGGWALVRASNTQPVLVMRFEADDEKLLEEYKGFMRDHLRRARPTLEVSF
ncbi:MAG: phosphomannomutase, partial [Deltaproteobacteria bacterium]|nr:phosphomannomutase [Deltaproteobacteria bacterium]